MEEEDDKGDMPAETRARIRAAVERERQQIAAYLAYEALHGHPPPDFYLPMGDLEDVSKPRTSPRRPAARMQGRFKVIEGGKP